MPGKQVAWVTGAGRGIGRGIAVELARNNFIVVGNGRHFDPALKETGLFEVKQTVEKEGGVFFPVQGDVSQTSQHTKMLMNILEEFGRIDVLVNNAGIAPQKRMDILQTSPESFDQVFSVNARGPFFLTQLVANEMIQQKANNPENQYCIIFISSVSARVSSPSRAEYCISKAALSHTARIYAHRLAEYDIQVYEIQPGIIKTDMTAAVEDKYNSLIEQGLIPQKRWGQPDDVARAVLALTKGYFTYSTGMQIEVSGGMNIQRL